MKPDKEKPMWSHYDHMNNAFATSRKLYVVGEGDSAVLVIKDDSFMLDISKNMVQHYELNPRMAQLLLRNGLGVYFYTYRDVLVVMPE